MSFDWLEYLNLAKEMVVKLTTPPSQEARLRDAVSRAYYAAFISARNYLRDTEAHSIPTTSDAHRYVWQQFYINPAPVYQLVAKNLKILRGYRNQADYDDNFPLLSAIANISIRRSEAVITNLRTLY